MSRNIWLKCSCKTCGSVKVLRDHVVLCIAMSEQSYAFTCPVCLKVTETLMGPRVFEVMLNTIVFDAPPITELDVHEFLEALERTDDPIAELGDIA